VTQPLQKTDIQAVIQITCMNEELWYMRKAKRPRYTRKGKRGRTGRRRLNMRFVVSAPLCAPTVYLERDPKLHCRTLPASEKPFSIVLQCTTNSGAISYLPSAAREAPSP
jgi:hypothetical protein